jgi:tetratricopeptide (TPR) repeat protein
MRVALAPDKTVCVEIEVLPGEIPQIVAQNPNDLILTLIGPDERKVDGFQFGNETITLDKPGHYRINLEIHSYPKGEAILPVSMSRHELSLQAAALWKSAEAMATTSKASRKLSDIQASLELWKVIGDSSAIGRTKLKLGDAFHDAGDQVSALDAYEQALADCRPAGEVRCAAEAANNSGLAARQLGEFELAHKRLQEAIEDWQYLHSPSNEGRTLSNLGILYTRGGDFQLALSTYSRAKSLLWQTDKLAYGRVLNNLGLCYLSLGEYEKSQIYLEQAIATETHLKEGEIDAMRARVNLGRTLMSKGRLTEAQKILESALEELDLRAKQGHGDATARGFALDDLGETLWREGQFEHAGELLKEALPMHRSARDRRGEARALHYLGLIAASLGQIEESRKLLGEAIQLRRVWGLRDDNADSLFELARLEFSAGNSQTAEALAEEGIKLLESVRTRVPGPDLRASFYARKRNLLVS